MSQPFAIPPVLPLCLAVVLLPLASLFAERTGEDARLARFLEKNPLADANKDGTLTVEEARAFRDAAGPARPPQGESIASPKVRQTVEEMAAIYEPREFAGMPYRLLKPIDLEESPDRSYPLILSFHGAGGKGTDNLKNLRAWNGVLAEESLRRKHPCFVVAPHSPVAWNIPGSVPDLNEAQIAEFPEIWRKVLERRARAGAPANGSEGKLGTVFALLDELALEFNIDPDRVYVLGHSMGGFGSFEAIATQPERFAAAIPSAGGLNPWHDPAAFADVAVWAFHGEADSTISPEMTRIVFEQMRELGGNMKYTALGGVGHEADVFAFVYSGDAMDEDFVTQYASDRCDRTDDVWEWLFAQSR